MENNTPSEITQKRLVTLFKDIKRLKSDETRFCFLIGAGASKSSGIKTGWELAEEWYKILKEDLSTEELAVWEKEIHFDPANIAAFYPYLYKKRYETSPQIGYEEFKKLMENIEPSIGYVILSQIITTERHNFVITTNFDYLIEDSVRMYTSKKPFSAGHETLAEFISSQTERPTIIKVHRDLFLHPFNDNTDTQKLKDEWKNALLPILRNFNLLVIGYGGNDGSLMDYLKSIDAQDRKAIYWCIRNENEINDKIKDLLTEKDFFVKIKGFDELMISLNDALDYKVFENLDDPDKHPFVEATKKRINNLNNTLKNLLDKISKESEDIGDDTKELFTGALKYLYEAYSEKDVEKKNKIYQKGLTEYPNNADVLGNYANFLKNILKQYDKAEEFYKKAIEINPSHANNLGNYAHFLSDIRKQYDKAEEFYKKAIEINPNHTYNLNNYAIFLKDIRKQYDKAEEFYKKAIEINPNNADFHGNYANFLKNIRKQYDKAEEFYKKAIEVNPNHANNLGNYALFLSDIRKQYDKAEEFYKKAIEINPNDANNLDNYALFLSDILKQYDKAEEFYKKAIEINPNDANNNGNYAHHLIIAEHDFLNAETYINKAFELADQEELGLLAELWFYRYAHYASWYEKGEQELSNLISKGAKSIGWNLEPHIAIAKSNHHPNLQKLQEFADLITK
ncbi:MAG: tetratricopeptide repeat protein [Chitinophagales bacterium]|nr:tetratricopeptide repeat protein [Chitinophagales bacterium]